jgi:hypothetical protein
MVFGFNEQGKVFLLSKMEKLREKFGTNFSMKSENENHMIEKENHIK